MIDIKEEMLKLLEEDEVFRYAVAGKLGILEVLKRLDGIERNIERLWQEVKELRKEAGDLKTEVKGLRGEVSSLRVDVVNRITALGARWGS